METPPAPSCKEGEKPVLPPSYKEVAMGIVIYISLEKRNYCLL